VLCIVCVLMLAGCGADAKRAARRPAAQRVDPVKGVVKDKTDKEPGGVGVGRGVFAAAAPAAAPAKKEAGARKIVYTAQEDLIAEDFDQARAGLEKLIGEYDAYVASSEVTGEPGEPRHGVWTLRVPAEKLSAFLDETARLGEVRRVGLDSEDVTDRYFDTQADAKNKEAHEEALRKLYARVPANKAADLVEITRELAQVRGEINRLKGQLQRWDKLVEYATLTLTVRDRKGYVPPDSPDFGTGVGRTFSASIDALVLTGKGVVYVAVAVAPWLAALLLLGAAVWLPVWLVLRRRSPRPPPPPAG
jgi:hypothetical protein